MKTLIMVLFGLLLCGCAMMEEFKNPEAFKDRHRKSEAQIEAEQQARQTKREDSSISKMAYEKEFPLIIEKKCKKKLTSDCSDLLISTLFAKFRLAYPSADWAVADLWCKANPIECDLSTWKGSYLLEEQLAQTHFANRRNRAAEESRTKAANIMQAFAVGMQSYRPPKTTNCTSNAFGSTVMTNCTQSP